MLPIVGCQRTSLIDYPQKIASVFFTPGCNLRCPYCHNPELVTPLEPLPEIPRDMLAEHLVRRRNVLDGVVITGGEPTLHGDELVEFIQFVKDMDYLVKLDTNGTNPDLLKQLLEARLLDYVAMDIKTSLAEYSRFALPGFEPTVIRESIDVLKRAQASGEIGGEFRTTLHPLLHTEEIVQEMAGYLEGANRYALQTFQNIATLDATYRETTAFSEAQMARFQEIGSRFVQCSLR